MTGHKKVKPSFWLKSTDNKKKFLHSKQKRKVLLGWAQIDKGNRERKTEKGKTEGEMGDIKKLTCKQRERDKVDIERKKWGRKSEKVTLAEIRVCVREREGEGGGREKRRAFYLVYHV